MFLFGLKRNKPNYVYAFCDTRKIGPFIYGRYTFKYEPFYIGKGSGNRLKRHKQKSHNKFVNRKVISIERSGFKRQSIKLFDDLTERQAINLEIDIIKSIGRFDIKTGPLLNGTVGGGSIISRFVSEDTKAIARANALEQMSSMTEEQIKARAAAISTGVKKAYKEGRIDAKKNALRISEVKRKSGNYWLKLSKADQIRLSSLRSTNARNMHLSRSEEEHIKYKEKMKLVNINNHKNMSETTKQLRSEKISNSMKEIWKRRRKAK